jgi:hypothetical protein
MRVVININKMRISSGKLLNLIVAYLLLYRVGKFNLRDNRHLAMFALGGVLMALMEAHSFARFHGG